MLLTSVLLVLSSAAVAWGARFNVVFEEPYRFRVIREQPTGRPLPGFTASNVIAVAEYNDTMFETGWDTMKIVTSPAFPDEQQAYAAGYFEGTQTNAKAHDHYVNNYPILPAPQFAVDFLLNHTAWLESTLEKKRGSFDPYWTHVNLMWKQWQGLFNGINDAPGPNMTKGELISLTSVGDIYDIVPALKPQSQPNWRKMKDREFFKWFANHTHCSSLFKVTEDLQDIYFGHVSWNTYATSMRIFKHITLNFNAPQTTAKTISMSSYPGFLSSFDDFYVTDSGFNVIETTLKVLNHDMYEGNIRPDLLLYWMRVMVSNRMARSAPEWASLVSYLNSGTYNNQWMILDLNMFTPGKPLVPNTMWVAEQMPGIVASQDVTEMLRYGYYPSYNVPMNATLFELGGYTDSVRIHGPDMNSYQLCTRARIFRRDQTSVTDLNSFKHMMQYNNFEQDPISRGNPLFAISARVDLDPHDPQCWGAIDAKVGSYSLWKQGGVVHAHSGATPQQPTFGFNTTAASCGPHLGIVEMYEFGWQVMKP